MTEPKVDERPIAADWWLLASAAQTLLLHDRQRDEGRCAEDETPRAPRHTSSIPERDGQRLNLGSPHRIGYNVGTLRFTKEPGGTLARIEVAPAFYEYCLTLVDRLAQIIGSARSFQQDQPTAADVVETYYRRKAAGGKATLKMLAEETGYSLGALKKAKRQYDAAGRWGSKGTPKLI